MVFCPQCGSDLLYKNGLRYLSSEATVQRWLCRKCGLRFGDTAAKPKSLIGLETEPQNGKCAESDPKNLLRAVNALSEKSLEINNGQAGATQLSQTDIKGKIVELLWWMQKQGYKPSTTISRGSRLRRLTKLGANLFNPESVKEVIATQEKWTDARKEAMVYAYDLFARWSGIKWNKPIYKPQRKLPFIPLEREIDDLEASCNNHIATFLQLGKETGARAGELFSLQWRDIDLENRTVNITPEKGSNPRIFKISNRLVAMLNGFNKEEPIVFSHYKDLNSLRRCFERYRKRAAHKFGNPRIQQITFHTLRHWKATTEYHKTKDILHVMRLLGHRNIKNTLLYTQLMEYKNDDDFICKVANIPSEIQGLIETGFEYICDMDGLKFFRKRK